jgi:hypothetical protein
MANHALPKQGPKPRLAKKAAREKQTQNHRAFQYAVTIVISSRSARQQFHTILMNCGENTISIKK